MEKMIIILFAVLLCDKGVSSALLDTTTATASSKIPTYYTTTGHNTTGNFTAGSASNESATTILSGLSNVTLNGSQPLTTTLFGVTSNITSLNSTTANGTLSYGEKNSSTLVPLIPKIAGEENQEGVTKTAGEQITKITLGTEAVNGTKLSISKNKPKLVTTFSSGGGVLGVGTIFDDTFILQEDTGTIRTFDRNFELKLTLAKGNVSKPYDMVSIGFIENIFVLDASEQSSIVRIRADRRFDWSRWLFSDSNASLSALSITPEKYILVTHLSTPKIKEFLPNGIMVKVINLATTAQPVHAVKVDYNVYAAAFGKTAADKHQVCLYDGEGNQIGTCYGGEMGSGEDHLNTPVRLLVTDRSTILIVDSGNGRIIELDSKLSFVKVLLSTEDGLHHPSRVTVDRWRGMLLVGDNEMEGDKVKGGKVLAYKI